MKKLTLIFLLIATTSLSLAKTNETKRYFLSKEIVDSNIVEYRAISYLEDECTIVVHRRGDINDKVFKQRCFLDEKTKELQITGSTYDWNRCKAYQRQARQEQCQGIGCDNILYISMTVVSELADGFVTLWGDLMQSNRYKKTKPKYYSADSEIVETSLEEMQKSYYLVNGSFSLCKEFLAEF